MTTLIERAVQRAHELQKSPSELLVLERAAADALKNAALRQLPIIKAAIDGGFGDLFPFWSQYAPRQRGRDPIGDNVPSGDLGEKVVGIALVAGLLQELGASTFVAPVGLPYGGDYRWIASINGVHVSMHIDIKSTGPRDNPNELVVPANQVTGFPDPDRCAATQSFVSVPLEVGAREPTSQVRPALSPLIPFRGELIPQLTAFVKFVYGQANGSQFLSALKLSVVPNGILLLGPEPYYVESLQRTPRRATPFNKGKDDAGRRAVVGDGARFRVLLDWLSSLDTGGWRVITIPT